MLKKIINKPYIFFFTLALIAIIIGLFNKNQFLEITLFDANYMFPKDYWLYFSAVFFMLISLNYFFLKWAKKPVKKGLTIIQILLQVISLLLLFTNTSWNWIGEQHYKDVKILNDNSTIVISISILLFILSIIIHLLNFLTSLLLKRE